MLGRIVFYKEIILELEDFYVVLKYFEIYFELNFGESFFLNFYGLIFFGVNLF